ncbi:hypothetical protein ABK040_010089 [Willaertia magna]
MFSFHTTASIEERKEELEIDKAEFIEYTKQVLKLESIHKITHINNQPYLVSLRVIQSSKHPITNEIYHLTTSNQTFNSIGNNVHLPNQNTASLLANLQQQTIATSGLQTLNTCKQSLENLQNLERITEKEKDACPKLLFTCSNINDEFYEIELGFDELSEHKRKISLNYLSWANYLNHLHYGLFIYKLKEDEDEEENEDSIVLQFDEENRESKDVLQLLVYAPLKSVHSSNNNESTNGNNNNEDESNSQSSSNSNNSKASASLEKNTSTHPSIRLKFSFELYAVRDISDFTSKLQTLVFDLALYNATLYETRVLRDRKVIGELRKELQETKKKLRNAQDRLILYNPSSSNITGNAGSNVNGEQGYQSGSSSDQDNQNKKSNKNAATKRKAAPRSLLNPNQKRITGKKGAKIQ